jgi:hypothetical protein
MTESFFLFFSFCSPFPNSNGATGRPDAPISSRSNQPQRQAVNQYLFLYVTTYALVILKLQATFAILVLILSGITDAAATIYRGRDR